MYRAVAEAEQSNAGQGGHLRDVAAAAGLDSDRTRILLHELTTVHGLVRAVDETARPDPGRRYETSG